MYKLLGLAAVVLVTVASWTQAQEKPETNDATAQSGDAKAQQSTFTLAGAFEPIDAAEVVLETEQAASMKIEHIVPHGTEVDEGDVVVRFQTEDLDKQVEEAETKLRLAELSMEETEFDYEQFLEGQRLDRAEAERAWQAAKDDYEAYVEFERDYDIESAKFSLETARFQLEYAKEDLRQLERMYKEDELTEESEELVLKRAQRDVEATEFRLKNTEFRTDRTLEEVIPREREQRQAQFERARMAHEKALLSLNIARQKKDVEFAEAKRQLDEQREQVEELKQDRQNYLLKAPAAGIFYHGTVERGQLGDKPSSLEEGTTVSKDQTVGTIVEPSRLRIRAELAERDFAKLKVGDQGTATPTAFADKKLTATVETLGKVPYAKGKFDCIIAVELGDAQGIMPGMTCSVEFPLSEQGDAEGDDAEGDDAEGDDAEGDDAEGDDAEGDDAEGDDAEGDDAEGDDAEGDDAEGDDAEGDDAEGDDAEGDDAEGDDAESDDAEGDDAEGDDAGDES